MLIKLDDVLPVYDKREFHETVIHASPEAIYQAVWEMDLSQSWVIKTMFAIRGMPKEAMTMKGLIDLGFNLLEEDPPREIVLGLTAKFWTSKPELFDHDTASFRAFDKPGYGKAAWNFLIEPGEGGAVRVATETRVHCTDARSRRLFSMYWFVIRIGSGWIRRIMLRIIKQSAERLSES